MRFRIETARLVIRCWRAGDRDAFAALADDPRVRRFIGDGASWGPEDVDAFLARQARHVARHGFCLGALCLRECETLVGVCGAQPLGRGPDAEVGWWLAPEHQGRGFAAEAARAVVRFLFERTDRERVLAVSHAANLRSTRVIEKLGMQFTARRRGAELGMQDRGADLLTYELARAPSR